MTYPQQPGQPYHPQPGHQRPHSQSGFPSGGGQPQYGTVPGYPQPGNFDPPPRKSRRGLLIGLAIGLVVLVALGVTGFVAPGFFLSKNSNDGSGGNAGQSIAAQFVDALGANSFNTGETRSKLLCRDAPSAELADVSRAALEGHDGVKFQLGQPQPDPANAQNKIFPVTGSSGSEYKLVIAQESGKTCVLHFVDTKQ